MNDMFITKFTDLAAQNVEILDANDELKLNVSGRIRKIKS